MKFFFKKTHSKFFLTFAALLAFYTTPIFSENTQSLVTYTWRYSTEDKPEFINRNYNDSQWPVYKIKTKLFYSKTNTLWLRSKINISSTTAKQALLISGICGLEQIYINGVRINKQQSTTKDYKRCNRVGLYPIPEKIFSYTEDRNSDGGETTLALRLQRTDLFSHPTFKAPIKIIDLSMAEKYFWRTNLPNFIYSFLTFFIGFVITFLHRKYHADKAVLYFIPYLCLYAFFKLTQNEVLYQYIDLGPFLTRFNLASLALLPMFFHFFYIVFFDFKFIEIKIVKKIQIHANHLSNIVFSSSFIASCILVISPNFSQKFYLPLIWTLALTPLYFIYILIALNKSGLYFHKSLFFIIGSVGFSFITLTSIWNKEFDFMQQGNSGFGTLLLHCSLVYGLLYNIVIKNKEIEKYNSYLNSVDDLQERTFNYFTFILHKPIEQLMQLIENIYFPKLSKIKTKTKQIIKPEEIENCINLINTIDSELIDLLELLSLEVRQEISDLEKIRLLDYSKSFFSKNKIINSHIHIQEDIEINTNINYLNLCLSHIMNLFTNEGFANVDVVILHHGQSKVSFHFLGFHKNSAKLREVYKICRHINLLRDSRWIRWGIICEYIRILGGRSDLSRVREHFLRISISLPLDYLTQETNPMWELTSSMKKTELLLNIISPKKPEYNISKNPSANIGLTSQETQKSEKKEIPTPKTMIDKDKKKFSSNMSISELLIFLKEKFTKS